MIEKSNSSHQYQIEQNRTEIEISALLGFLWAQKLKIITFSAFLVSLLIGYLIQQPNVYTASSKLFPNEKQEAGLSAVLNSQLGGLASLAGISDGGNTSKVTYSLEVLKSKTFLSYVINKYNWKPVLIGSERWDIKTKSILFDQDIYDSSTQSWTREVSYPLQTIPSDQEVVAYFLENNFSVSEDKKSGAVIVSVTHVSPVFAKKAVDILVSELNTQVQQQDIAELQDSIQYLKGEISQIKNSKTEAVVYSLIEQNTQALTLAKVRQNYMFKILDPAVVPEEKSGPKRAILTVLGSVFVFGFICFIFVVIFLLRNKK